jgi:hypothetical protein
MVFESLETWIFVVEKIESVKGFQKLFCKKKNDGILSKQEFLQFFAPSINVL